MELEKCDTPEIRLNLFPVINLPNCIMGNQDFKKKINLGLLTKILQHNHIFKPEYDLRKNPRQNFVTITIHLIDGVEGKFWVFANGTCRTNMQVKDEIKLSVLDLFYKLYAKSTLED